MCLILLFLERQNFVLLKNCGYIIQPVIYTAFQGLVKYYHNLRKNCRKITRQIFGKEYVADGNIPELNADEIRKYTWQLNI